MNPSGSGLPRSPGEIELTLPPKQAPPPQEPPAKKAHLPRGTKQATTLATLAERARKASVKARRAKKSIAVLVDEPTYEALIELAETYATTITEVARQCLFDGLRKYKDFNSPYNESPFRSTSVMRAYPHLLDHDDRANHPQNGKREDAAARRAIAADELTGPVPGYDESLTAEIAATATTFGAAFLPQGGGKPITLGDVAFDPLAPVQEPDPGQQLLDELTPSDDA